MQKDKFACETVNIRITTARSQREQEGEWSVATNVDKEGSSLLFHDCREPGIHWPWLSLSGVTRLLKQVSDSLCNVVSGQWTGDEYEWSSVIVAELWLRSRAPGYWEHLLIKTNTNGHSRHTPSPVRAKNPPASSKSPLIEVSHFSPKTNDSFQLRSLYCWRK